MSNGRTSENRIDNVLTSIVAVVTGALVFLPSILGAIAAPYVLAWLLPIFWILGCVSIGCLGISVYFVRFKSPPSIPHRLVGIGFWSAIVSLGFLAIYVGVNMWEDRVAAPRIVAIEISPETPEAGDTVKFAATAIDQNADQLNYRWQVNGRDVEEGQTVYWTAPAGESSAEVLVVVDDGRPARATRRTARFNIKKLEGRMADEREILIQAVKAALAQLEKRDPNKFKVVSPSLETDESILRLAEDFDLEDVDTRTRLIQGAFLRAIEQYPQADLKAWFGGKRPCCSAYPATWPFCNPKC